MAAKQNRRTDPARTSAAAQQRRRALRLASRRCAASRSRGAHDGPDRRRDGSNGSSFGCRADDLRHVQGARQRHHDRSRPAARAKAAARAARGPSTKLVLSEVEGLRMQKDGQGVSFRVALIVLSDRAASGERADECIPIMKRAARRGLFDRARARFGRRPRRLASGDHRACRCARGRSRTDQRRDGTLAARSHAAGDGGGCRLRSSWNRRGNARCFDRHNQKCDALASGCRASAIAR